jgi:hypothetical protein
LGFLGCLSSPSRAVEKTLDKISKLVMLAEQIINSAIYFLMPILLISELGPESGQKFYLASNLSLYFIVTVRVFFFQTLSYYGALKKGTYYQNLDVINFTIGLASIIFIIIASTEILAQRDFVIIILALIISDLERVNLLAKLKPIKLSLITLVAIVILTSVKFGNLGILNNKIYVLAVLSPYLISFVIRFFCCLRRPNFFLKDVPFKFSAQSFANNIIQVINATITLWYLAFVFGPLITATFGFVRQCQRLFSPFQQFMNISYMQKFAEDNEKISFEYSKYFFSILLFSMIFFSILSFLTPIFDIGMNLSSINYFLISMDAAFVLALAKYSKYIQSLKINSHSILGSCLFMLSFWAVMSIFYRTMPIIDLLIVASLVGRFIQSFFVICLFNRVIK